MNDEKEALTTNEIVELSKEYTFFSWAIQSQVNLIPIAKAKSTFSCPLVLSLSIRAETRIL